MEEEKIMERIEEWIMKFMKGEEKIERIKGSVMKKGLMRIVKFDMKRRVEKIEKKNLEEKKG